MPCLPPSITVIELKAMLDQGQDVEIVDVRNPNEFNIASIPGSKLIPLESLTDRLNELDPKKIQVVLCKLGARSALAASILCKHDFNAYNLLGGILAWAKQIDPELPTY